MAGKYAAAARRFPKADPKDVPFQERVDQEKALLRDRSPAALARRYHQIRRRKDRWDRVEARLNARLAAAEQLMWDAFGASGMEQVKFDGGGSVSVGDDLVISVTDAEAMNRWARESGLESKLTLYNATVEAIMRERILAGVEVPTFIQVRSTKKTNYRRP